MTDVSTFCSLVRKRSSEHKEALDRLYRGNFHYCRNSFQEDGNGFMEFGSVSMSILRMELDSMVRVIYLLTKDIDERERLIRQTLAGEQWTQTTQRGKYKRVTDKDMVLIASKLQGWTQNVYSFGCSFIHLSNFHLHDELNPLDAVTPEEKKIILKYLRHYHSKPESDNPSYEEILALIPCVFNKIYGNLKCYLNKLESNNFLDT